MSNRELGLRRWRGARGPRAYGASTALHRGLMAGAALASCCYAVTAHAEEPRKVTEPRVFGEPSEITNVVDAFDGDDPIDIHLTLGYQHTWKSAKIRRETFIDQSGLAGGGYTANGLNVAEYSESTARLNTKAEIGIFKDLALIIRLPIILANDRELSSLEGSDRSLGIAAQGEPGEQLFRLPFKAPTRSGIEYLALGLDFGIMNQYRDPTKPTWVFGFEGRFNVSEPMHACNENESGLNLAGTRQVKCAEPSDIDRDGVASEHFDRTGGGNIQLDGTRSGTREAGVSRGTTALEVHTYLSKRIKYIEPYGGFRALFEFQNSSSDYGQSDLKGTLVNHPPIRGTFLMGLNVIPWEVRDQHQRVAFDFRFAGTYVSEGRDYSELFDALGSSDAPSLRAPNFAEYQRDPAAPGDPTRSVVNPSSQKVYFTGLTDVQQHGEYRFSTDFVWQAGEYIKFNVGAAYTIVQGHLISFDQPCNPDHNDNLSKSGPCRRAAASGVQGSFTSTGIPNPNYRASINVPGRRFKVDDSSAFEAWLNATVMF